MTAEPPQVHEKKKKKKLEHAMQKNGTSSIELGVSFLLRSLTLLSKPQVAIVHDHIRHLSSSTAPLHPPSFPSQTHHTPQPPLIPSKKTQTPPSPSPPFFLPQPSPLQTPTTTYPILTPQRSNFPRKPLHFPFQPPKLALQTILPNFAAPLAASISAPANSFARFWSYQLSEGQLIRESVLEELPRRRRSCSSLARSRACQSWSVRLLALLLLLFAGEALLGRRGTAGCGTIAVCVGGWLDG
jgi:hypothetical protein